MGRFVVVGRWVWELGGRTRLRLGEEKDGRT